MLVGSRVLVVLSNAPSLSLIFSVVCVSVGNVSVGLSIKVKNSLVWPHQQGIMGGKAGCSAGVSLPPRDI